MTEARAAPARRLLTGFSLEMTGKDAGELPGARASIPPGTRINVTFLGSEDRPMRVAAARAVRRLGCVPVPHVSARRLTSRPELADFLSALRAEDAAGEIFVVGGDPGEPIGRTPTRCRSSSTAASRTMAYAGSPSPDIPRDIPIFRTKFCGTR